MGRMDCFVRRIGRARAHAWASKRTQTTLGWRCDNYACAEVTSDLSDFRDADRFGAALDASLQDWQREGIKGVWLKVPTSLIALVPIAVEQHGFVPHHAAPGHVMLRRWLRVGKPDTMPQAASHFCGVAGFVLNSRHELLMIQEATGPAAKAGIWKLPGGLVAAGENICDACVREGTPQSVTTSL